MPIDWTHVRVRVETRTRLKRWIDRVEAARQRGCPALDHLSAELTADEMISRLLDHVERGAQRKTASRLRVSARRRARLQVHEGRHSCG